MILRLTLLFSVIGLFGQENQFIENSRQLIYEGNRSGEGYFSEDGNALIFQSERQDDNPFYQIYMLDFLTGDIHRVSNGVGKTTCAYFEWGQGKKVMYSSSHLDPQAKAKQQKELDFRTSGKKRRYSWDYEKEMDIFACNRDGTNTVRLTNALGYDAEGSYAPDGSKIAFCSNRHVYNTKLSDKDSEQLENDPSYFGEIYIMDADGSNVVQLTDELGYDGGPFFSPDGERIIWRRFDGLGHIADIYTMKLDGSDVQKITEFESMSWAPYYHPSQEYVIFASNKLGFDNFEIFIVDAAGTKEPVQVTFTEKFDGLPVFSPDGKRLSWTSSRNQESGAHLFIGNWNHNAALKALANAPNRTSSVIATEFKFQPEIIADELHQKIEYLSHDLLEGRLTGSKGIELAADFVAQDFEHYGLTSFSNETSYFHSFDYSKGVEFDELKTKFAVDLNGTNHSFSVGTDYVPLSYSDNEIVTDAEIVFVGYGIKTPEGHPLSIDNFSGLDLNGKVVMMLEKKPSFYNEADALSITRYADNRYKTMVVRELGGAGIIFVNQGDVKFKSNPERGKSGLVGVSVSENVANQLLQSAETTIEDIKSKIEENNPHFLTSFPLPNTKVGLNVSLEKVQGNDNNILGVVTSSYGSNEYLFIGGHYDHLGHGHNGSRAIAGEEGMIHNGADDNASGTALVMELAEYFATVKQTNPEKITKNLVFALWSGEEMGLLGSSYFCDHLDLQPEQIVGYLNYDMVGRLKENKLIVQGLGSAKEWKQIIEKKNVVAGFNLSLSSDPYLPTDATSFYKIGAPVLSFFTGVHEDYHRPTDDIELIEIDGVHRIANFSSMLIHEILKPETTITYQKVEMSSKKQGTAKGFSVYLGTIPDYGADVKGVKLTGVRAGGPADRAGIQAKDIIIALAGKEIQNIYDYTHVLADLVVGKEEIMVVIRDGEKVELKIVPEGK